MGRSPSPREIISMLMAQRGLSQRRLAEMAGLDQPSLSKYLSGQTQDILAGNLIAIAQALEVSVGYIAGDTDDPKVATVVRAMQNMPEYKKDAVVATAAAPVGRPDAIGQTLMAAAPSARC